MPAAGLILLAAGGSRRLGRPKQLLRDHAGYTLIRRAASTALESVCRPIIVVLGAGAEDVAAEIQDLPLTIILNPEWQTGMASSIKTGLTALQISAEVEAAVLMLCDQPQVSSALINSLAGAYEKTKHEIVACEYGGLPGVPALFDRSLFGQLADLEGEEGARRVIRGYAGETTRIPFDAGLEDIDTPEEASKLLG